MKIRLGLEETRKRVYVVEGKIVAPVEGRRGVVRQTRVSIDSGRVRVGTGGAQRLAPGIGNSKEYGRRHAALQCGLQRVVVGRRLRLLQVDRAETRIGPQEILRKRTRSGAETTRATVGCQCCI